MDTALASEAIESAATGAMGSAISGAASKGAEPGLDERTMSKPARVGIKATEIILSSASTAVAITVFNRISKRMSAPLKWAVTALVSVIAAIVAAAFKVAF